MASSRVVRNLLTFALQRSSTSGPIYLRFGRRGSHSDIGRYPRQIYLRCAVPVHDRQVVGTGCLREVIVTLRATLPRWPGGWVQPANHSLPWWMRLRRMRWEGKSSTAIPELASANGKTKTASLCGRPRRRYSRLRASGWSRAGCRQPEIASLTTTVVGWG
jgi:hypothetical protein